MIGPKASNGGFVCGNARYLRAMIVSQIDTLLIGGPKAFRADGTKSAMARDPVDRPVMLRKLGFEGDQVADPTVHGGVTRPYISIQQSITPDGLPILQRRI